MAPAVGPRGRRGTRGGDAIQAVMCKGLTSAAVQIVGDEET